MKKILIVEDNKTLAKLIAKKLSHELEVEVDVAYTLFEAKLFLAKYDYFVTLLDINLPDAPNGEIVDYVLKKGLRVIVLSGNTEKTFRKTMLQKDIVDYVNKSGINDIDYIIQMIARLEKNKQHKVLVVDDSMMFRNEMKKILTNLNYNVITVAHGEEALGMLELNLDITLVIVDYFMPVMDGLVLTSEIRKKYSKSDICIIALSSNEDDMISAMFLKQGANDYITKPFSKEEFSCRINNSAQALENIQAITNHANRDFLTGLYNRRYFFNNMNKYTAKAGQDGEKFVIAMIDIDDFKQVSDTYGQDVGDEVIVSISEILRTNTNAKDIVARFGGEEFCIVLKDTTEQNTKEIFTRLLATIEQFSFKTPKDEFINCTVSIGVANYADETLQETINQADMMLYNAKNNGKNQVIYY